MYRCVWALQAGLEVLLGLDGGRVFDHLVLMRAEAHTSTHLHTSSALTTTVLPPHPSTIFKSPSLTPKVLHELSVHPFFATNKPTLSNYISLPAILRISRDSIALFFPRTVKRGVTLMSSQSYHKTPNHTPITQQTRGKKGNGRKVVVRLHILHQSLHYSTTTAVYIPAVATAV